jgi:hypothetical protein
MNRLHLLMGFKTTAYDVYGFGTRFAQLVGQNWYMGSAWFKACDQKQPPGVVARVLGEEWHHFYDRQSYQYPDSWDNYYYIWTHTCGSELARQVDVSQVADLGMPVFETPPLDLDTEATPLWENLTAAFDLPEGSQLQQGDGQWSTEDGGKELEMDPETGLYYYIDHNQLYTETVSGPAPSSVRLLTADQAQATADAFLTNNGLMPGDAQFYEVAEDTQAGVSDPGRQAGLSLGATEVVTETTDYQVIYSRIITYTPPGLNLSAPLEFSVVGPGAKLKVYVEPTASALQLQQEGTGDVSGAMGGWRRVQASEPGLQAVDVVDVLPYEKVEKLFEQLEPEVSLANVPFENPDHKEVLTYTLAYWEGPAGVGQSELIPAYALTAVYTGTAPGVTEPVTGVTYIPSNPLYMRPYAKIVSNSAEGETVAPGDEVVLTAADASQTLAALGYDDSLDFVLGNGPFLYEWYRDSVADENLIDTGQTITYTVDLAGEDVHKAPVVQNIVLRVVDSNYIYEADSLDSVPVEVMPPLYLPAVVR